MRSSRSSSAVPLTPAPGRISKPLFARLPQAIYLVYGTEAADTLPKARLYLGVAVPGNKLWLHPEACVQASCVG